MSKKFPLTAFLLTSLVLGCAAGPGQEPVTQASAADPHQQTDELLAKGQSAAAHGDAVRAEQYLALAIEQGADRRRALPILLRACLASSHLRAALNYTEPYLREHPDDDALRYLVANIHVGLGQEATARRELEMLLARDATNPEAHYLLGVLDAARGKREAREHFNMALEYSKQPEQKTEIQSRLAELRLSESHDESRAVEVEPIRRASGASVAIDVGTLEAP